MTLDAEAVVKVINGYAKQNTEMKFKMKKGEEDEVLDELTREVKVAVAHCPLIMALGQKAMLTRHWNKVYTLFSAPLITSHKD